ncbi:hypothetical protein ABIF63_003514 [Bradyrhizobium japonicum]|uniref:Uncharacterized protein n=1 Tax=Bradyrhizobium japonicum TaxID=375 RepID=A0ABV2RR28_BRAJP
MPWQTNSIRADRQICRYAERALAGDKKADDELKRGLKDSFPASDPPSNTQPPKTVDDAG